MTLYECKRCGLIMVERPTREKGRCNNGSCGHKLFPDGYIAREGHEPVVKIYPAPSWEEDLR